MRNMKGQVRNVDLHHEKVEHDPFAELTQFFESEIEREGRLPSFHADRRDGGQHTAAHGRDVSVAAPPLAYEYDGSDLSSLDEAFDSAFVEDLSAPSPATPRLDDPYQSWVSPHARISHGRASHHPGESPAAAKVVGGDALERAIHGLSAPANPRHTIVVETQSFAPERVIDDYAHEPAQPELDEFDELIASELAVMQSPVHRSASQMYATSHASGAVHDDEVEHELDGHRYRSHPGFFRRHAVALCGGAISLAVVGAVGFFVWNGEGAGMLVADGNEPLLIKADTTPYKTVPKDPGGRSIPNQNKAVYDRVASPGAPTSPIQSALLTDSEEPIELPPEEEPTAYENLPGVELMDGANIAVKDEARVDEVASLAQEDTSPIPVLQPRKVRTMVVRPDGTIVPSEAAAISPAATAVASAPAVGTPVAQKPAVATIANGSPALIAASSPTIPGAAAKARPVAVKPIVVAAAEPVNAPVDAPADVPFAAGLIAEPAQAAPMPEALPTRAAPQNDPMQVAAIAPQPQTPSAATPAAAGRGGYFVQISSQPSEAAAQSSLRSLSGRYAGVIEGRSVGIQAAEIPGKGTFYRVRVATGSKDEASALCNRLKSAGGNCFVAR